MSLLMNGLPNSGSTWFAALLAQHIPGCRYYDKEFFNPICNLTYERVLRRNFGCELVGCFDNIALPGRPGIDDDIRETWGRERFTFTKECNSAFKLPTFVKHFNCFVFLRKAENTFPPGRVRVWSFYEHAWWALQEAGYKLQEESLAGRAIEAHGILEAQLLKDAAALDVPVIWWEDLFTDPYAVVQTLGKVCDVDAAMVGAITEKLASRELLKAAE